MTQAITPAERTLETSLANLAEKMHKHVRSLQALIGRAEVLQAELEQLLQRSRERFGGQPAVDEAESEP